MSLSFSDNNDDLSNRPYKCEVCGKAYNSKIYLRDHLTIHSDIRAYQCNICTKKFRFGSNLSEHRTVHMVDNLFFKCTECNHAVRLRGNLKKHMKMHFKDNYELEKAWLKLRESGFLDVGRSLRHEMGDRRTRSSHNSSYRNSSNIETKFKAPLLNNSFTFGETIPNIVTPPTLSKHNNSVGELNKAVSLVALKNSNSDNGPPALISVTEAQRRAQMKKDGEYITEEKIAKFKKVIEDSASIATTVDNFFARLDNIIFEETNCPFCFLSFSSFGECEEHIFISHDKPNDLFGNMLFCDICLKLFDNMESKLSHQGYHDLIDKMISENVLDIEFGLQEFKD